VAEIKKLGRDSVGVIADVTDLFAVENMIRVSVEALGPLNVIVANAGIAAFMPMIEFPEGLAKKMFEVNVFGVYYCYLAASKQFIKQGTGGKLIGAARYTYPPDGPQTQRKDPDYDIKAWQHIKRFRGWACTVVQNLLFEGLPRLLLRRWQLTGSQRPRTLLELWIRTSGTWYLGVFKIQI
jgi:hypothetical protein